MRISNDQLTIEIASLGAELQSITDSDGGQWLWHGDPKYWSGRAPLLFPVVGKSRDGAVSIEGNSYPTAPHGFARKTMFSETRIRSDEAHFTLAASGDTRKSFPFEFLLTANYRLEGSTLVTRVEVTNTDNRSMPFGFGFHPAFSWPLPGAAGKNHALRLKTMAEPAYQGLDADGLILPKMHASPFVRGKLALSPKLFEHDALIFPNGVGDGIVFEAEGGASLALEWSNLPNFAVWTKPNAPYLCLEPWHGMAARAGSGDGMTDRPSPTILAPNAVARFELSARFIRGAD